MAVGRVKVGGNEEWVGFIGGGAYAPNATHSGKGLFVVDLADGVCLEAPEYSVRAHTVRIEDGKPTNTVLYAENYGAKSSGRYRYGLQHTVYDVGGTGGRLGLGTLISNSHMHNYYVNYEMPVGRGGSTLGLGLSQMDYKLGGAMRAMLAAKGIEVLIPTATE